MIIKKNILLILIVVAISYFTFFSVSVANAETTTMIKHTNCSPIPIGQCNTTNVANNAGGCGTACGNYEGGTIPPLESWTKFNVKQCIETETTITITDSGDIVTDQPIVTDVTNEFIKIENVCATGDRYNSNDPPRLNYGTCDCNVGNPYKVCCDGSQEKAGTKLGPSGNDSPYNNLGGCGYKLYSSDPKTGLPAAGPRLTCPQPQCTSDLGCQGTTTYTACVNEKYQAIPNDPRCAGIDCAVPPNTVTCNPTSCNAIKLASGKWQCYDSANNICDTKCSAKIICIPGEKRTNCDAQSACILK